MSSLAHEAGAALVALAIGTLVAYAVGGGMKPHSPRVAWAAGALAALFPAITSDLGAGELIAAACLAVLAAANVRMPGLTK